MSATFSGLIFCPTPEKQLPVPLKSVQVHVDVRGWSVGIIAELAYQNSLAEPLECQFVFPLADNSAIYRLEADIAGKTLYAECRPRKEAEETYRDAVQAGHTGVLLENQAGSPDVFRIMLGNLPANGEAKVTIGFVQPAQRDSDGSLTFTLPTVLNPRYVPRAMLADPEKMKDHFHFKVPYVAVSQVSYSISFDAKIALGVGAKIADIKAANETKDAIKVVYDSDNKFKATVTLDGKFDQDHDFGLRVTPADPFKPMVYIEPGCLGTEGWLSTVIVCALFDPEASTEKQHVTGFPGDEFWFVVDRSGSMGGPKIEDAKTALVLFVKSLPSSCKFNIIGFGSSFSALFAEGAMEYDETTVERALEYSNNLRADMGGTEILEPLKFIYSKPKPTENGARRFIVLLTDGEVGNTEQVVDLARQNAETSRVFAVGIGEGASTALVNGLARVSGGLSEFVRNSQDRLQAKVISLLKAATRPGADNVSLKWDISGGKLLSKMPDHLPTAVYQGRPLLQYALFERHPDENFDGCATLMAAINGVPLEQVLLFTLPSAPSDPDDAMPLHRLAAKARLQELFDSGMANRNVENVKAELVAISLATGVLCNETAFVAVDSKTQQLSKDHNGRPCFINIERPSQYLRPHVLRKKCGGMQRLAAHTIDLSSAKNDMIPRFAMSFSTRSLQQQELRPSSVASTRQEKVVTNDLELLVRRQKLDGSWVLSDELAKLTCSKTVSDEALLRHKIRAVRTLSNLDDSVLATLIGIAILRRRFSTQRDEWELIEQKAIAFLQQKNIETDQFDMFISAIATELSI